MFEVKKSSTIPVEAGKREAANKLPFASVFANALKVTVEGLAATPREIGEFFVPASFWVDRAENKEKAAKKGTQQEKLRNAFRAWQKGGEKDANVAAALFLTAYRPGGSEEFPQAGMSVWVDIAPERAAAIKAALTGEPEGGKEEKKEEKAPEAPATPAAKK